MIRRYGLVGEDVSLEMGFEVSKTQTHTFNPSTLEAEAGMSVSSKAA